MLTTATFSRELDAGDAHPEFVLIGDQRQSRVILSTLMRPARQTRTKRASDFLVAPGSSPENNED